MKIDAQKYSGSSKLLCPTHHYVNQNTVPTLAFNTHALVALLWSYEFYNVAVSFSKRVDVNNFFGLWESKCNFPMTSSIYKGIRF
jgi:hypothetical protein